MTRTDTIFGEHGIMAHTTMMAKPIRALELHYPMIQILIIMFRSRSFCAPHVRESKTVLDSGLHTVDSGTGFQSLSVVLG